MAEQTNLKNHSLTLKDRENLVLSGVEDVPLFDEQTVSVLTTLGNLVVKGTSLHITKLSLDIGEVVIEGHITGMQYLSDANKKSMLRKLLK